MLDLTPADLERSDTVFEIGVVPGRIDLLTGIDGVTFEEAWSDHISEIVGGIAVPVISRAALIRRKKASGRPKDIADARVLEGG